MMRLFFYELHEGATDLLTDAILVSEQEHSPEAFAAMVRAAKEAAAGGIGQPVVCVLQLTPSNRANLSSPAAPERSAA